MWGFGAPDNVGAATAQTRFDWGFGDYEPASLTEDWGFGDVAPQRLAVITITSLTVLPDDGGDVVKLEGAWPILGPYRITLYDSFTGDLVAAADSPIRFDSKGNVVSREHSLDCYTNTKINVEGDQMEILPGRFVFFVLPKLPPSKYNVVLNWGVNNVEQVTLTRAIEVIQRGRSQEQWTMRSTFSNIYKTGASDPRLETPLVY